MRDGEDGGPGGVVLPRVLEPADDRDLDTPNCPDCLMRMEAEESISGDPFWTCTECGLVSLT